MAADPMDLLQGTLDVLILRSLADRPRHGYDVSRWVRERTDGTLRIEDAPLYKALRRLEHADCLTAEWGVSESNRRARYYRLTPTGRKRLREEESAWRRYADAVFQVLKP
ncbi:MAG TPA: PadR family transcriptional regulator [Vicinamibacterales bacterium]|nr:PadR family transcriptional regulator [Vicinamibacterales bacterium]